MTKMARAAASGIAAMAIALASAGCAATSEGPRGQMVTDRPDFTESASTVVPGGTQVEAGYTATGSADATRHDLGEVLVRAGVVEWAEVRLGIGSYGIIDPETGPESRGLTGASVGAKVGLPGTRLVPDAALLLATTLPPASTLDDPGWAPSAILAAAWPTGAADIGANLGYVHAPSGAGGELLASVAAGLALTPRVGSFVELYGRLPAGGGASARATADAGFTLAITPDLQLDLRVARSLVGRGEAAVGVGLAVRP